MNSIFVLAFEYFKIGAVAIGGGYTVIPFLYYLVEKYNWFDVSEITQMIAISNLTPGPIGINIATYVGFTTENLGVFGAIFTTLSLVLPSIIVILIIAGFLEKFKENKYVKNAFYGLRAAVVGLLAYSFLAVIKTTFLVPGAKEIFQMVDFRKVAMFAVILFLVLKFKKHPILYIGIGAVCGIIFAL